MEREKWNMYEGRPFSRRFPVYPSVPFAFNQVALKILCKGEFPQVFTKNRKTAHPLIRPQSTRDFLVVQIQPMNKNMVGTGREDGTAAGP